MKCPLEPKTSFKKMKRDLRNINIEGEDLQTHIVSTEFYLAIVFNGSGHLVAKSFRNVEFCRNIIITWR